LKLAIQNITNGKLSGGYIKYLNNILPLIYNDKRIKDLCVYVPSQSINYLKKHDFIIPFNNKHHLELILSNNKPDIIFAPSIQYVKVDNIPLIIMVRNMEPLSFFSKSNPYSEILINYLRKKITFQACKSSDAIIAVSNFVKNYLIDSVNIDKEKIKMIYHGSNSKNYNIIKPDRLKSDLNFIFTAGSIRPARGLFDILKSFKLLLKNHENLFCVIAGSSTKNMKRYEKKLIQYVKKNGMDDKIIWLGHLSQEEINWCYQNCKCFVMSSRVEACPNIALEAMSNGSLIISTKNKPMPEFFENNIYYYKSGNALDLANKLEKILKLNKMEIKEKKKLLKKRADFFSWEKTANQTISFIEKVHKIDN